jgi:SAM-dependent methyltransferase
MESVGLPSWTSEVLCCPATRKQLELRDNKLMREDGATVAHVDQGVIRLPVSIADQSVTFYRNVGGPHFHERSAIPFAMSTLDTPIYHAFVDGLLTSDRDAIIVDVGGGDGRNARHCLNRGFKRVVVVDAVAEALLRFRQRVVEQKREWLDRLLLIEADARALPLRSGSATAVIAVETLCYLNEDYEYGLKECIRLMGPGAKILLSERDYEGGLVLRLLYHGVEGLLELAHNRSLWDGPEQSLVRSRCFTESELIDLCRACGLKTVQLGSTPLLALLLGYLNGRKLLDARDSERQGNVSALLTALARHGAQRRCHVVIAERVSD